MRITVNGWGHCLEPQGEDVSYEWLCHGARRSPMGNPMVVYALPDGRCGRVLAGRRAPLVEGAVYEVLSIRNA